MEYQDFSTLQDSSGTSQPGPAVPQAQQAQQGQSATGNLNIGGRQGAKTKKACDSCRSRKKKCNGLQPW